MPSFLPENPVFRHKPRQLAGKNNPLDHSGESFLLAYSLIAATRFP
ncbi:MAG: hypothetical protein RR184_20430 [Citrobacter sp.]|nr:hypothetical protein [Citrobacter tructae]